jgi:hypothetical protein
MAISRMTEGDAVDLDFLNTLIDQINALEDANNVQVYTTQLGRSPTSSLTSRMCVQAGTLLFSPLGQNYERVETTQARFPVPFAYPPVVTITPQWSGNTYVTTVHSILVDSFNASVQHHSGLWTYTMTGAVTCNWIAVGVVNNY